MALSGRLGGISMAGGRGAGAGAGGGGVGGEGFSSTKPKWRTDIKR